MGIYFYFSGSRNHTQKNCVIGQKRIDTSSDRILVCFAAVIQSRIDAKVLITLLYYLLLAAINIRLPALLFKRIIYEVNFVIETMFRL